ncbi:ketoacyl-ACP synthase III [Candidatus Bipolaricaulota bacterium]|nr:ketoacyl-ACP synthase III [Candidatus Bipolaricaulota bacterium]
MLYLHSVGHFFPENVIDNEFLRSLDIGTDEDWILERVGIHTRRTVLPLEYIRKTRNRDPREANAAALYSNAQTGVYAARMALERAGVKPADIGMVISGGCSPQWTIPPEACLIAAELGIDAPAFDVNSACSSFAAQLHFLNMMKPSSSPDFVLLVNAENNTRVVDYNDRRTAVLWGDGTAAAVVSPEIPAQARIVFSSFHSDPRGWSKVTIPVGGHFNQEGSAVQAFAIRTTVATLKELRRHARCNPEELLFIGHQANLLMLQSVCDRAGIGKEQHLFNVDTFGNCGAAGAPSVLSQHWDDFAEGDEMALVVVGSGLAWGGLLIRFGGEDSYEVQ